MASAVYPIRNEAHWGEHKVYMRKYTNHNHNNHPNQFSCNNLKPSPSPNLNPNPNYNPSINRYLNQTPNTNNPNPSRFIHDSSSRAHVWQNDEPSLRYSASPLVASSSRTVDITKGFSQGGYVTFHLGSYSRRELKVLRNRFISELERVRIFRYQIETRELEFRSNYSVQPPLLQPNTSNAAASVVPSTVKKKKNAGTPRGGNNKKISGQKRAMPFSSGRETKRPANAVVFNSAATQKVVAAMMRRCGQILAKLMKHKHGWVFNKPVDTVSLGLHNYHEIIKHPMDLGTVKSKLGKHAYGWPLDFASDVRLTFENAMTYNAKGDDAHTMATILLNMFEEMFTPAYQKFAADHQRIIAAQKNMREPLPDSMQSQAALSQQNVMKPLPDLMLPQETLSNKSPLIQAPASIAPREAAAKPAIVHQRKLPKSKAKEPIEIQMSHDERKKLGLSLQNLPVECTDEVLQIVRKRNSGLAAPDGDGEVELDIQALDNETMWELDKFVNLHKNVAMNKARKEELIRNSPPALHLNKQPQVVELMIQEAAVAIHKAEEDIDIGDEMPMNNYPPLEIEKDAVSSPATSGRSRNSGSSSSGSDSSSTSDSDSESSSGSDSDADSVQQSPLAGLRESPGVTGNP